MNDDSEAPAEGGYDAYLRHHDELDAKALADRDARFAREGQEREARCEAERQASAEAAPAPAGSTPLGYYDRPAPGWPSPEEAVRREFERYAGQLVPGAAATLAKLRGQTLVGLTPERRAEAVAKFVNSDAAKRYLDPEAQPATLADGRPMGPVRAALSRYPELKPGAVEELTRAWSVDLAGHSPERLAGEIVKRLGKPEAQKFLTRPVDRSFDRRMPARPEAKPEPARNDAGRFQGATKPPEKRRPSSTF